MNRASIMGDCESEVKSFGIKLLFSLLRTSSKLIEHSMRRSAIRTSTVEMTVIN